ncbi:MAG: hypothetical protein AAB870_01815, partial [Patescibacteria group bacterium]
IEACEELYDKNIQTLSTSANKKDVESGSGYIIIDFDSLSEENKAIAQQYGEMIKYHGRNAVAMNIAITESSTSNEITQKAHEIASLFVPQLASWIHPYTIEELKAQNGISDKLKDNNPSDWPEYYYDPANNLFYDSEEHFHKLKGE